MLSWLFIFIFSAQANIIDDLIVKKRNFVEQRVSEKRKQEQGFSNLEIRDLDKFKLQIPLGTFYYLKLSPEQIESLDLKAPQMQNVIFDTIQLSAMELSDDQFDQMELSKEQKSNLKLSSFEVGGISRLKKKLQTSPQNLTTKELEELGLSSDQFEQLNLTPSQILKLVPTLKQISLLQESLQTQLVYEQFEQLKLTKNQLNRLRLNSRQYEYLQVVRFKDFQLNLAPEQLAALDLTYSQMLQLRLNQGQLSKIQLLPGQISFLGVKFLKSNVQGIQVDSLARLQESSYPLTQYQFKQLNLEKWQVQNLTFNLNQVKSLREYFESQIEKQSIITLIDFLYPYQVASLNFTAEQVNKILFSKDQLKDMEITENQLSRIGINNLDELQRFDQLGGLGLSFEQIMKAKLLRSQVQFVDFSDEQYQKIVDLYNKNVVLNRVIEHLKEVDDIETANSRFLDIQLSKIELSPVQLALVDFTRLQLQKSGISEIEYRAFQKKTLESWKGQDIQKIEKMLIGLKVDKAKVVDFFKVRNKNFIEKANYQNVRKLNLSREQIEQLGITYPDFQKFRSGVSNKDVNDRVQYRVDGMRLTSEQILDLNISSGVIFRKELTPLEKVHLSLSKEDLKGSGLDYKDLNYYRMFYSLKEKEFFDENSRTLLFRLKKIVITNDQLIRIPLSSTQLSKLDLNRDQVSMVQFISQNEVLPIEGDELALYRLAEMAIVSNTKFSNENKTFMESVQFKGQKNSLIPWDDIDTNEFLSLEFWKEQRKSKENYPFWKNIWKEQSHKELVARVLDCVGDCVLYKGDRHSKLSSRSKIHEGDEVVTGKGGHLYILLLDGQLIKVAPETSLTFHEVNIGTENIFFNLALNWGNIRGIARDRKAYPYQNQRETEQLFLPLAIREANIERTNTSDLFQDNKGKKLVDKLNDKIDLHNTDLGSRYSSYFITFFNGYLNCESCSFEILSLMGNKSYIKIPEVSNIEYWTKQRGIPPRAPNIVSYSGEAFKDLEYKTWYQLNSDGDLDQDKDDQKKLYFNDYLTSYIPTLLHGREIFFQRYFKDLYSSLISPRELANKFGYRLWGREKFQGQDDMNARMFYVKKHALKTIKTRKRQFDSYQNILKYRGKKNTLKQEFKQVYFKRSMEALIRNTNNLKNLNSDVRYLNSLRKKLWDQLNFYNLRDDSLFVHKN